MKINSLYPIIVSDNAEKTMEFYASIGFTTKHVTPTTNGTNVYIVANGDLEMEIMEFTENTPSPMPVGLYGFRMNVDDLDAAVETFKQNGGTIVAGPFENEWTKLYMVKDVDGNNITLMKHILSV